MILRYLGGVMSTDLHLDSFDEEHSIFSLGSSNDFACISFQKTLYHDASLSMRQIGRHKCYQHCLITFFGGLPFVGR